MDPWNETNVPVMTLLIGNGTLGASEWSRAPSDHQASPHFV